MKKLLFNTLGLLVVTCMAGMVIAQSYAKYETVLDRAGTNMGSYKYGAATKTDTSKTVTVKGWKNVSLVVRAKDSCSITVYYQPSYDGITFYANVIIDSMSSDANGGEIKAYPLPAAAFAFPYVRFSWIISAFRLGKTNDTLNMMVYKIM